MTEDKFLSLMVSDKVVVKTIHEQNMATFFATINSLLDGNTIPWPTFEKDTMLNRPYAPMGKSWGILVTVNGILTAL
jgi:hypothetical protein